jgi:hypothetical protein
MKLSTPNHINKEFLTQFFDCPSMSQDLAKVIPIIPLLDIFNVAQTSTLHVIIEPTGKPIASPTDPKALPLEIARNKVSLGKKEKESDESILSYLKTELEGRADYANLVRKKGRRLSNAQVVEYWSGLASILTTYVGQHYRGTVSRPYFMPITHRRGRRSCVNIFRAHYMLVKHC